VLSSPLSRAWESAELTGFGDRAQPREDLLEWDYGEYEGLTTAEIRAMRPGWDLWRDGCPGGETAEAAGERVDRVIDEALRAGGDVLCFAHSHVLRVLGARWIEQSPRLGGRIVLDTAAISRLGFERETRVLRAWNLV
jgi:probable phosphoglycerate mutase